MCAAGTRRLPAHRTTGTSSEGRSRSCTPALVHNVLEHGDHAADDIISDVTKTRKARTATTHERCPIPTSANRASDSSLPTLPASPSGALLRPRPSPRGCGVAVQKGRRAPGAGERRGGRHRPPRPKDANHAPRTTYHADRIARRRNWPAGDEDGRRGRTLRAGTAHQSWGVDQTGPRAGVVGSRSHHAQPACPDVAIEAVVDPKASRQRQYSERQADAQRHQATSRQASARRHAATFAATQVASGRTDPVPRPVAIRAPGDQYEFITRSASGSMGERKCPPAPPSDTNGGSTTTDSVDFALAVPAAALVVPTRSPRCPFLGDPIPARHSSTRRRGRLATSRLQDPPRRAIGQRSRAACWSRSVEYGLPPSGPRRSALGSPRRAITARRTALLSVRSRTLRSVVGVSEPGAGGCSSLEDQVATRPADLVARLTQRGAWSGRWAARCRSR